MSEKLRLKHSQSIESQTVKKSHQRSSKLLRAVDASGLNLKMTTNVDFIRDLDILCFLILFFCTLSAIQTIYERKIAFKTQSKY